MPVISKPNTSYRDKLPTPVKALADMFFPADELPMDSIAAPMMAAGRAAKGLVKGIKGWQLPDGKIAKPVLDGVNRIFEGDDAAKALYRMQEPVSKQFARNPMPPSVSHPSHLSDVSVPIPDSLDTNVAPGFPTMGSWQTGRNQAAKRTAKANETIVRDMRALHDTGLGAEDINRLYPDFSYPTIYEIIKRQTWAKVK